MEQRILGRSGRSVSVVGLGTWQLGADWGDVDEDTALAVLDAAAEAGVTLFDTADVYGDGRSEQLIGRWRRANPDHPLTIATKMGRRVPQKPENYTLDNFRQAALGVSCFRRVPCRAMAGSQARPVTMTACSWRSTAAAMTVCAWVGVSLLCSRPVRCR
jgi:hypothetical protein